MRITIVSGFFLPVPPVSGGATEKSWFHLAREFAQQGHAVTFLSRRWPGWAADETAGGIRHLRLPGNDHRTRLWQNLFLDFLWSWRVFFALPPADIVVVNAVALPVWLGLLKPRAGRVVLLAGRMPKGQYRCYRRIARVLVPSSTVQDRLFAENPVLVSISKISGYPIDAATLRGARPAATGPVTIGYVGRLHEEKGLRLLVAALARVAAMAGLPAWRVVFCGPDDVARGGSGADFRADLERTLRAVLPAERVVFRPAQFDNAALADIYRSVDVFCYPSLAEQGETFGVAVVEAMAAGAVPVVSSLACFTDFVAHEANGLVFDHQAADAAGRLALAIASLLRDPARRATLAAEAVETAMRYDYAPFATSLLADFAQLTDPAKAASSAP